LKINEHWLVPRAHKNALRAQVPMDDFDRIGIGQAVNLMQAHARRGGEFDPVGRVQVRSAVARLGWGTGSINVK